jgi:hypothetical protein
MTLADSISREYLVHHRICPKAFDADGALVVAVSPNAHLHALDDAPAVKNVQFLLCRTT